MSIPVLIQVYDETRRLAIAGSAVVAGDFRLKKLVPPLEESGKKAPVFAKVAQAVQAVVDSNEKTASIALLELTTLVNAILYTQGETGIAGELKPLETTDLGGQATQASARILKPLLEALSSTGSGRIELVRDAHERGIFKDLRLVKAALNAIDDPYPEIGQFMCEHVLPMYGKAILPQLREKLDVKGRGGHIHRLQLMHQLDAAGSRDVIQLTLSEGSKEMRVAAVECLGKTDDDLTYLLEQAKAKAKDVRAAALRALSAAGTTAKDVIAALKKAIDGEDLELIVSRVNQSSLPEIRGYVLEQAEKQFAETLKLKDAKAQGPAIHRMQQLASCMHGWTEPTAEAFVLKCFESAKAFAAIKSEPSGSDFNELAAQLLCSGTPKMQQQLVAAHKTLAGPMLSSALFAARATMAPAAFYDEFRPLLKEPEEKGSKKAGGTYDRRTALSGVLTSQEYRPWMSGYGGIRHDARRPAGTPLRDLDPRWLDAAVEAQSPELVYALARPGHGATNQFLSDRVASLKEPFEMRNVLQTMVRIQHPGATDTLVEVLKKNAKETYFYHGYWYGRMIPDLPKSALPQLEALLPTLPDKMIDQLMDAVLALKNKAE